MNALYPLHVEAVCSFLIYLNRTHSICLSCRFYHQELTSSPRRLAGRQVCQQEALGSEERADSGGSEKETAVVKSPSDHRLVYLLQSADDIKFADDGDDDCEDIFIKDLKVDPKTVPLLGKRGDLKM